MSRQREYRRLMEHIRNAHEAFRKSWTEVRAAALKERPPDARAAPLHPICQANAAAYEAAQPLADRRTRLLRELFEEHVGPQTDGFLRGDPNAVDAVIEFLDVDVSAFQCGYAKEGYLRRLKSVPLTEGHRERLRQYGLGLCGTPAHRREIGEAGRLMIRVADQGFVDQLRALTTRENDRIRKKSEKMLGVVLNGRHDLI